VDNWRNGILGVVVGDALGCPVQFKSREEVRKNEVTDMRGHGTFDLPKGSWTDDSSLTLATLDAILEDGNITVSHVARNFLLWLQNGKYTPYGYAYDIGNGCYDGIMAYKATGWPMSGGTSVDNNGNGSLMRIMPACIYCATQVKDTDMAISLVQDVSKITHAHMRAQIACGIYYFIVNEIINDKDFLDDAIQTGIHKAFAYYIGEKELSYYIRIENISKFKETPESEIRSSGYVVDSLEASIWCLINTSSYKDAVLKAVNLGGDTDTIGAITGGLAGLYYGFAPIIDTKTGIPYEWVKALQNSKWIYDLCTEADRRFGAM